MFKKSEIFGNSVASKFASMKGAYKLSKAPTYAEISEVFSNFMAKAQLLSPVKIIMTESLYFDDPEGKYAFSKASEIPGETKVHKCMFSFRPSKAEMLTSDPMRACLEYDVTPTMFDDLLAEIIVWCDKYQAKKNIESNIAELNAEMLKLKETYGLEHNILFTHGTGIVDAYDNTVLLGLSTEAVADLEFFAMFDTDFPTRRESFIASIVDLIKSCNKAYEIVKKKEVFTTVLGVYENHSLVNKLRKTVKKSVDNARVGDGYFFMEADGEKKGIFGVVTKTPVSSAELAEMNLAGKLVVDNASATKAEKEAGKDKIVVAWKISPINTKTLTPATHVTLESVLAI